MFYNPKSNDTLKAGDLYKREIFTDTLERIAENGFKEFYSGETAENLVKDIQSANGIISLHDLHNYK